MILPYQTATAGSSALAELQKTLAKFGCQSFGTMTDAERGLTIVQFKYRGRQVSIEASWKGYAAALVNAKPYKHRYNGPTRQQHDQKALEQAQVSVCSVLRDWIKGQITAVECGILSFDAAFMPHLLLANGRRMIDAVSDAKMLPAPEDAK